MNGCDLYSEEMMNSFIDDQLSIEDRTRFYDALAHDSRLVRHICRLWTLRAMIQAAYDPEAFPAPLPR